MKEISVIIVSWNGCALLRKCLDSIRETGLPWIKEVFVVDNASSDGSADMVATEFPEVILVRSQENLGFARANNVALRRATGRWLALVNSDVVVHPGCFEALVRHLSENGEVGLIGPKVFGRDGKLQRTCRRFPSIWNTLCRIFLLDSVLHRWPLFSGREMMHWDQETQAEVGVLSGCFWMARRSAVEKVGELDERFFFYAEDVDWCKRFWQHGWKVVFVPAATASHFDGGSSANAPLHYSIEMLRANLTYWRKHHGFWGHAAFYLLSIFHQTMRLVAFTLKRVVGLDRNDAAVQKRKRSAVCLWWLLTGRNCARSEKRPPKAVPESVPCQKT